MRTIIAGSRSLGYEEVCKAIQESGIIPTTVISGGASGVDQAAELWARTNKVPLEIYQANWQRHGRSAGYIRNSLMVSRADCAIICWDGTSKGALHCAKEATRKGLRVFLTQSEPKPKKAPDKIKGIQSIKYEY